MTRGASQVGDGSWDPSPLALKGTSPDTHRSARPSQRLSPARAAEPLRLGVHLQVRVDSAAGRVPALLRDQRPGRRRRPAWRILNNLVAGISNGSIWALVALGYTLVYGIIELINFAHGEVFMIGSFVSFGLYGTLA